MGDVECIRLETLIETKFAWIETFCELFQTPIWKNRQNQIEFHATHCKMCNVCIACARSMYMLHSKYTKKTDQSFNKLLLGRKPECKWRA